MSEAILAAAQRVIDTLDKEGEKLTPSDWYELLQEVAGRVSSYEDCYREENSIEE